MTTKSLTELGLSSADLAAIGKLSEKNMTPDEIANAIEKIKNVNSSADEINKAVNKVNYNNLQSIPFANAQALEKDTWNKNYGAKIENNKITPVKLQKLRVYKFKKLSVVKTQITTNIGYKIVDI